MTYSLVGCVPIRPEHAVVVDRLVASIAAYAGEDGANFCSLFSDDSFASVCFPGLTLTIPVSVADEIERDVHKLAAYKSDPACLMCVRNARTTTLWINDQ